MKWKWSSRKWYKISIRRAQYMYQKNAIFHKKLELKRPEMKKVKGYSIRRRNFSHICKQVYSYFMDEPEFFGKSVSITFLMGTFFFELAKFYGEEKWRFAISWIKSRIINEWTKNLEDWCKSRSLIEGYKFFLFRAKIDKTILMWNSS